MATKNNKDWHEAHIRFWDSLPFGSPFSRGEPGLAVVQVSATRRSVRQHPVSFTTCLSQSKIRPTRAKTDTVLLPQTDSIFSTHPAPFSSFLPINVCLSTYFLLARTSWCLIRTAAEGWRVPPSRLISLSNPSRKLSPQGCPDHEKLGPSVSLSKVFLWLFSNFSAWALHTGSSWSGSDPDFIQLPTVRSFYPDTQQHTGSLGVPGFPPASWVCSLFPGTPHLG